MGFSNQIGRSHYLHVAMVWIQQRL